MDKDLICDECGSTNEVIKSTVWWTAWGRNCFDFNWEKNTGEKNLCIDCEDEGWAYCYLCGALIDIDHYGTGYLPDDPDHLYEGEPICPECAEKEGFEITVNIGSYY